jgi:hypothetical protein
LPRYRNVVVAGGVLFRVGDEDIAAERLDPERREPFATFGSVKPPGVLTSLNDASKTSTRPLWKSVAYRRSLVIARPL